LSLNSTEAELIYYRPGARSITSLGAQASLPAWGCPGPTLTRWKRPTLAGRMPALPG